MNTYYTNLYLIFTITLMGCLILCVSSCKNEVAKEPVRSQNLADSINDSLDIKLSAFAKTEHLPGFVAATFTQDSILFAKGYGYRDLKSKTPYNTGTIQMIASVSKTIIPVALMKLVEKGQIDIDAPINNYLPYKVVNPHFPEHIITVRHLATHTASFDDSPNGGKGNIFSRLLQKENWRPVWHPIIAKYNQNKEQPMDVFLRNIFSEDGDWYTPKTFHTEKPGNYYDYSNYGAALVAHIIEIVAQEDYQVFTQKEIFEPLKMNSTGWSRSEVDTLNHITYYNDNYSPCPDYKIITYPDGGLYTNLDDLIRFTQEMMKGYLGKSAFLDASSFKEMMRVQYEERDEKIGLMWDLSNDCCIGHGGNDFGIATMVYFDVRDNTGKIVLSNIDVQQKHQEDTFYSIFDALFNY